MYNQYYGFRESPFSVAPDPRFFYHNPSYTEAFANLRYGIEGRKGFVLLTGEVGTGKTTLLRRLMEHLDETQIPFAFLCNTRLRFEEMLSFFCDELGLPVPGSRRLPRLQILNDFLLKQFRKGKTTALLIDEAHDLDDDTLEDLRLLSNFETAGEKLLQIVLVGQTELEQKLAQPSLRQLQQRVALRISLDRLKPREVERFIRHRLEIAGYRGPDLFTPEAIALVARVSKGLPRLVNVVCDNALLITYGLSKHEVSLETVAEVSQDLALYEPPPPEKAVELELERAFRGVEKKTMAIGRAHAPSWYERRDVVMMGAFAGSLLLAGLVAAHAFFDRESPELRVADVDRETRSLQWKAAERSAETPAEFRSDERESERRSSPQRKRQELNEEKASSARMKRSSSWESRDQEVGSDTAERDRSRKSVWTNFR